MKQSILNLLLIIGIAIGLNVIGSHFYGYLDLTEEKRYTLTQPTHQLLENLDGYDIQKMKIPSPVTKMIVFRVGDALQILTNHAFRHIAQAQRVTKSSHFPQRED